MDIKHDDLLRSAGLSIMKKEIAPSEGTLIIVQTSPNSFFMHFQYGERDSCLTFDFFEVAHFYIRRDPYCDVDDIFFFDPLEMRQNS